MKVIINNPSSDEVSYVSGLVVVPAGGSLDVPSGYWERMYSDIGFLTDVRNANLILSDGVSLYRYPASEVYFKEALNKLVFEPVRKDFTFSSAQTNTSLWTPTSGKKFVVTDFTLNIRNSTLGALTVTIFDETNSVGNVLYKANFESGANYDAVSNLITSFVSGAVDRSLKITTSGSLLISGTIQGYETE